MSCHVCGCVDMRSWCTGLLECPTCSHVQADMQLSTVELADLYSHKYFHGEEYVDYAQEREALNLNFNFRLKEIKALVPPGSRLFEIGCAYGYFLEMASREYKVAGCDISQHAIDQARASGLNAVCADYLTLPPPDKPYDIICMWDTIEHLAAPCPYVEKAFTELAPGGTMIISTGDAGSHVARFRREKWRMVHPPTHLHYFTAESMTTMLKNAGFKKVEVRHDPFYRNLQSSLRKVSTLAGNPLVKTAAKSLASIPGASRAIIPINLYDIMTVQATKSP